MLLLGQVGFVAIAAPRFLMGAFPIVGINLLSDFPGVRGIQTHYATAIAPFVIAAAILGTATIARRLPRLRTLAAGAFVAAAMGAFWLRGTSPGSPEWRWSAYRFGDEAAAYRRIVATTDPNAEVAANVRLLAHLAERRVAHMGPETGPPIIGPPQSSPE